MSAVPEASVTMTPVVETAAGKVRGLQRNGIHAFLGIRYGASTAAERRFMPPAPPLSWTGIRDSVELGPRAPQGGHDILFRLFPELERPEDESEDCLCLNIWTPGLDRGRRPVMVWLHGGGYVSGSGGFLLYDGERLARREDVVAITVNHRLNVFGFLDVAAVGGERYAHSANLGLQDIIAALRWIQTHIERFGGDPSNVTIYGESGGGGKVSTLLAMPAAQGLFHRAIIQSGPALRQNTREVTAVLARDFLGLLQLKSVDELQQLPMEQVRSAVSEALARAPFGGPPPPRPVLTAMTLGPVVDGEWLPQHPFEPSAPALSADIPLLIGHNETEATFFPGMPIDPIDTSRLSTIAAQLLRTDATGVERVLAAYRQDRPDADALDVLQRLQSDLFLGQATQQLADRKASLGRGAVYAYYFNWRSPVHGGRLKSFHTLEIPFVMQNIEPCLAMVGHGAEVAALADRLSGAWAAFARSGDPSHAGLRAWRPYELVRRETMVLGSAPQLVADPHRLIRAALAALSAGQV